MTEREVVAQRTRQQRAFDAHVPRADIGAHNRTGLRIAPTDERVQECRLARARRTGDQQSLTRRQGDTDRTALRRRHQISRDEQLGRSDVGRARAAVQENQ